MLAADEVGAAYGFISSQAIPVDRKDEVARIAVALRSRTPSWKRSSPQSIRL